MLGGCRPYGVDQLSCPVINLFDLLYLARLLRRASTTSIVYCGIRDLGHTTGLQFVMVETIPFWSVGMALAISNVRESSFKITANLLPKTRTIEGVNSCERADRVAFQFGQLFNWFTDRKQGTDCVIFRNVEEFSYLQFVNSGEGGNRTT